MTAKQHDKLALLQAQQQAAFETLEEVYGQLQRLERDLHVMTVAHDRLRSENARLKVIPGYGIWLWVKPALRQERLRNIARRFRHVYRRVRS